MKSVSLPLSTSLLRASYLLELASVCARVVGNDMRESTPESQWTFIYTQPFRNPNPGTQTYSFLPQSSLWAVKQRVDQRADSAQALCTLPTKFSGPNTSARSRNINDM